MRFLAFLSLVASRAVGSKGESKRVSKKSLYPVSPAKAGVQKASKTWIPARSMPE